MGQNDRQDEKRRSSHSRRFQQRTSQKYDLTALDLDALWACLVSAMEVGGALRIGATRDGGALAIGVYGDGDPYTEYLRAGDTGTDFFGDLRVMFEGLADEQSRKR